MSNIVPANAPVAEHHHDLIVDLGSTRALVGNVPVDEDISCVENFGDWRASHQRLAGIGNVGCDHPCDRRENLASRETALDCVHVTTNLPAKFVQIGKLNSALGDFGFL